MMKQFLLVSAVLLLSTGALSAQKYGHLNFGNLISSLEATKAADKELEEFQNVLVEEGEEKAKKWQKDVGDFMAKVQEGELTPKAQQEKQAELEGRRDSILAFEQEISQRVQMKRKELLEPIVTKVEAAIEAVGKENNYLMIFDTSMFNAILFAEESDDITDLVKAKL